MDILPCPFCGNSDIEPSRYDVDMYDGTDGIDDSIDDAEDTARILLIRKWNARWTPSDRGADELV